MYLYNEFYSDGLLKSISKINKLYIVVHILKCIQIKLLILFNYLRNNNWGSLINYIL